MALDTQAKRASAIHVSSPWRSVVPAPDGAIGQGDRQAIAYYCGAVLMANGVIAGPYIIADLAIFTPGAQPGETTFIFTPGITDAAIFTPGATDKEVGQWQT